VCVSLIDCKMNNPLLLFVFFLSFIMVVESDEVVEGDGDIRCEEWSQNGECSSGKNAQWMKENCSASCTAHKKILEERCDFWAEQGECDTNPNFMWDQCKGACETIIKTKELSKEDNEEEDYGTSIGYDGLPFHIESVKQRSQTTNETLCYSTTMDEEEIGEDLSSSYSCVWPPPIVRLPANYPAEVTLAPPLPAGSANPTLDELHSKGILTFAHYMRGANSLIKHAEGVAVKLVNFSGRRLKKMWDNGSSEGVYNGELSGGVGDRSVLMTYHGHTFKFVDVQTGELYQSITMKSDVHYIVFQPDDHNSDVRNNILSSPEYLEAKREERFMEQYYQHHGYPWLARYGRPAPVLNMWPANYLGQTHTVETSHSYWICDEPDNAEKCHPSDQKLSLDLTVASYAGMNGPRVFVLPELMSEAECDHILRLGSGVVKESMVGQGGGGFKSSSRTSSTGWLGRRQSPILETLQRRFGDMLGLDESRLTERDLAEQLQVVRYEHGQQYNPHHDFSDSSGNSYGQRFLTLLLYVVVPDEGGHTSFPKAFGGRGVRIKPPKRGGAVLFYSMLPDGNGDDLSLHAGEVVERNKKYDNDESLNNGNEKWVCNLWIWDPDRQH